MSNRLKSIFYRCDGTPTRIGAVTLVAANMLLVGGLTWALFTLEQDYLWQRALFVTALGVFTVFGALCVVCSSLCLAIGVSAWLFVRRYGLRCRPGQCPSGECDGNCENCLASMDNSFNEGSMLQLAVFSICSPQYLFPFCWYLFH